jgi:hypothetical protein
MADPAWLAYTLTFIIPEERQILQMPSLADRATYGGGRSYALTDLKAAINARDVTTQAILVQRPGSDTDSRPESPEGGIQFQPQRHTRKPKFTHRALS